MSKLIIEGGNQLCGTIDVQGAKNAVLPILAATILTDEKCIVKNCPCLRDVDKTVQVLNALGCDTAYDNNVLTVNPSGFNGFKICDNLMRQMRSSIIFLGAILSRCKKAVVSMPGGCPIGSRPIDLHLKSLHEMGVSIKEEHGYIICKADKLKDANIHLDFPSVGATENIMLAAAVSDSVVTITNAAREPEIADLERFLNSMGANVHGAGGSVIRISGVRKLHGVEYSVMPDRIVAATYLAAGAITGGSITLNKANARDMGAMINALREMNVEITVEDDKIYQEIKKPLKNIYTIRTMPYPGFPTDIQSPFMALATLAKGTSVFVENIFENRFQHVEELLRMGADITLQGRIAVVRGVKRLQCANVIARELRGGASLVIAALSADGTTEVEGIEYIDRGYEHIEECLSNCGANIRRL